MFHKSSEIRRLLQKIDEIEEIKSKEWMDSLSERKRKELEFHDKDRDQTRIQNARDSDTYEKFYGNKKYYSITKRSNRYVKNWIARECKDKIFLDYACGNGGNAIFAAKNEAALSLGFDISSISVENARKEAQSQGLENVTRFFQADAENTKLPDNAIDIVICSGMLHHLDISYAFCELRRILKPGGKILAVEALDYNPAIKLYRFLTPDMRTDWEKSHILDLSDIQFASRFFDVQDVRFWHVVGYAGGKFPGLASFFDKADIVLENIPLLQRMAWIFTFVLQKNS